MSFKKLRCMHWSTSPLEHISLRHHGTDTRSLARTLAEMKNVGKQQMVQKCRPAGASEKCRSTKQRPYGKSLEAYTPPTKPYYSLRSPFGVEVSSCANCIVIKSENCHFEFVMCIDCTGPTLGDASKNCEKLAEQLRDNYGGIILDRVRKDI